MEEFIVGETMIGVIGENLCSIQALIKKFEGKQVKQNGAMVLFEGKCCKEDIVLVCSGYGKVNIGIALGYILGNYEVTAIIGIGSCSSISYAEAKVGNIAIATCSTSYDVDFTCIGEKLFQLPGICPVEFISDMSLVTLAQKCSDSIRCPSFCGKFASADRFVCNTEYACHLQEKHRFDFLDGGASAIGQVGYLCSIPTVSIKGISNFSNEESGEMHRNCEAMATLNAQKVTYFLINELVKRKLYCNP